MVELLITNYAGRTGIILEQTMGYYRVSWTAEKDGSPLQGVIYWIDKRKVKVII